MRPGAGGPAARGPASSLGPGVSALTLHLVTVANSLPQHGHSVSAETLPGAPDLEPHSTSSP